MAIAGKVFSDCGLGVATGRASMSVYYYFTDSDIRGFS